jgi:hypothetical protein
VALRYAPHDPPLFKVRRIHVVDVARQSSGGLSEIMPKQRYEIVCRSYWQADYTVELEASDEDAAIEHGGKLLKHMPAKSCMEFKGGEMRALVNESGHNLFAPDNTPDQQAAAVRPARKGKGKALRTFEVDVKRVQLTRVTVEAESADDAKDQAQSEVIDSAILAGDLLEEECEAVAINAK